jgi:hypothetical protein
MSIIAILQNEGSTFTTAHQQLFKLLLRNCISAQSLSQFYLAVCNFKFATFLKNCCSTPAHLHFSDGFRSACGIAVANLQNQTFSLCNSQPDLDLDLKLFAYAEPDLYKKNLY